MQSPMTEKMADFNEDRIGRLKHAVQSATPGICIERPVIWTQYFKNSKNRKKSPHIQIAEALREVLLKKSIRIYSDELIVGNFYSKRVGGSLPPELHGTAMMEDIFRFPKRDTNPLQISRYETRQLLKIVPFWLFRFLGMRVYRSPIKKINLIINQLRHTFYVMNELGGISHIAPDYEKLIKVGTDGIIEEAADHQRSVSVDSDNWYFFEAVKVIAEGLAQFGERYAALALRMSEEEGDTVRKGELRAIAKVCQRVPRNGATSFHEAVQSTFFAQIAVNLEGLDNSVCPGRMDQYLFPYYERDIGDGTLTRERAKELLSAFSIKMSEIIPVFSKRATKLHGGMFNGQVVTVGGTDSEGRDSTNELSLIFLEVMDRLRMRQPNFHARIHARSPEKYLHNINKILAAGSNSPALYNDDVIVETLCKHGYAVEDARNYTGIGCVEPVCQGKSFSSTDAAICNVPIMLELALNRGRRFGSCIRSGIKTMPVQNMKSMDDVTEAFEAQLGYQIGKLIKNLRAVEIANRRYHPTPLTSMLLDGCLESGVCSTAGGARYNFSGIQCVGPADTGDALFAIEKAVFVEGKLTLKELVRLLKKNLNDPHILTYLRRLDKFGNDVEEADRWTNYVARQFDKTLQQYKNTRRGRYVTGLYSVTSHQYYGQITGAMPYGRKRGESFSSGISPVNGMDRSGPTALVNSLNRIDFTQFANGISFNIKFDRHCLRGETGLNALNSILRTYFSRGGMQIQVNVFDPEVLLEARHNPDLYPNLLVRVSGYSAYFNDLSPEMKDEIIQRSCVSL